MNEIYTFYSDEVEEILDILARLKIASEFGGSLPVLQGIMFDGAHLYGRILQAVDFQEAEFTAKPLTENE